MPKDSEQPASWRAFTKPPSSRAQPEEPVVLDFDARAQDFLKRITTLSADLATHGRTRTLALQKLHRICQVKPASRDKSPLIRFEFEGGQGVTGFEPAETVADDRSRPSSTLKTRFGIDIFPGCCCRF